MTEPTLSERMMRVALLGVVPADDPHVIADAQQEIDYLKIGDNHLQEERAKLEAEIGRLRAALKQISALATSTPARIGAPHPASVALTKVQDIALEALTHEQSGESK